MSEPPKKILADALAETRPGYASAIFFSFFINLLALVGPLYMLQIYDRVISSRNIGTLVALTVIAFVMLLVYGILDKVRSKILLGLGLWFDARVRGPVFNAVARGTLLDPASGHSQALRALDSVREFLIGSGPLTFCDVPWIPLFIAACFILHVWFGLIATVGGALIFAMAIGNELFTRALAKDASRGTAAAATYAAATLRNAEVLHAMGMVGALRERWLARQRSALERGAAAAARSGTFMSAAKFVRTFLQVAILGAGAYLAIEQEVSPGAMIAASIIMGRALAPVEASVSNWSRFLAARAAYDAIATLLRMAPEEPQRMRLPAPRGEISVENVSAVVPGGKQAVLANISFLLQAGEALGVIGPSAAGKSSLARILVGVWRPARGRMRIDGADVSHWNVDELGPHIGYLPQDVELFSGSVAENISRFGPLHEDKIIAASMTAGVHQMVQRLPEGYDTQIGEGGHTLSGGQRQRIGLARALYGNPAVIVLDEPNANLDAEGEAALVAALGQLRQNGQTVILITHKTSLLAVVDRLLVLKAGEVHAFGTFDEVVSVTEPAAKAISELPSAKMPKATPLGPVALVG